MSDKPLFIPLKTEWYNKFLSGEKDTEYRPWGWVEKNGKGRWSPWNERTCKIGRDVVICKGYGKKDRILGKKVVGFEIMLRRDAPEGAQKIYPNVNWICAIKVG